MPILGNLTKSMQGNRTLRTIIQANFSEVKRYETIC